MMQQAAYLQITMLSSHLNDTRANIELGVGMPGFLPRVEMPPPPPFMGGTFNLNNINVKDSTIGTINTGTIQQLDSSITQIISDGQESLAAETSMFIEQLLADDTLDPETKNEISEQLNLLLSYVAAEPKQRPAGVMKSLLVGIKDSVAVTTNLSQLWEKLEPLLRSTLDLL